MGIGTPFRCSREYLKGVFTQRRYFLGFLPLPHWSK